MPTKTKIEWTDYTSNPIVPVEGGWGCTKVSTGCENCYSETLNLRWGNHRRFQGPWEFRLKEEELEKLAKLKGSQRIFICDMTDLFHDAVPWELISQIFVTIITLPQHTFQILTKRPGRMAYFAKVFLEGIWPPNVWAGTSVESAKYLPRLDVLARVPAKVRFVSVEPLLGPVDLTGRIGQGSKCPECGPDVRVDEDGCCITCGADAMWCGVDWVIVGGESGPKARPMHPDWARQIKDDCQAAGVPFFFKQWGEWVPWENTPLIEGTEWKSSARRHVNQDGAADSIVAPGIHDMHRVGKKAAGAVLDGREWREMPNGDCGKKKGPEVTTY